MDNLKLIEQRIDQDIDPNGAPESIKAENHNAIEKLILASVGKYVGFQYIAKKTLLTVPTGEMSWDGNPMNNTGTHTIKIGKMTRDLIDVGRFLSLMTSGDMIQYKDYIGRTTSLQLVSFEEVTSGGNTYYVLTVKGFAENTNYVFGNTESQIAVVSFSKSKAMATPYGELRWIAKGIGNTANPWIEEPGDIFGEGFMEESPGAIFYWDSAIWNGGDKSDPTNFTRLSGTQLTE